MKKGEYVDEQILRLKGICQTRTADYNLLTDEIPIQGKSVRFQWFSLFDGEFCILLPEDFVNMPEQIAKIRYINIYRPPVILTNPNYNVNFGFHLLEDMDGKPDELIRQMKDTVLFQAPETVFYEKGTIAAGETVGSWFEYKNFTVDEETYNMQFMLRLGGWLLVGTFNCRMVFYDGWKPLVLKSLEQIKKTGKGTCRDESR